MRTLNASLLAAALSVVASGASAQLYKWVDANGTINYGDWPPPGVKYQPITHGTVSSVSGGPALSAAMKQAKEEAREQPRQVARGQETQVNVMVAAPTSSNSDDVEYAGAYAPYYGYPARRAAAREAIDRPRVDQPIVKPVLPIDPAIPDMPMRSRR